MAGSFSLMSCLLLSMATVSVQHSGEVVSSTPQTDQNFKETMLHKLLEMTAALHECRRQKSPQQSSPGQDLGAVVTQLAADLQNTQTELKALRELKTDQGSTFVRWGRKSCPANTSLVYTGFAGGKYYRQSGSGSNRLCLSPSPQFDNTPLPEWHGELYGSEYQKIPGHHDHDVPCSVCRTAQSTTIMIAGTLTCPAGWTAQYACHLSAERTHSHHFASDYVCLDANLEDLTGGANRDENGLLFHYIKAVCGPLPCPPYINGKVVTCAVCSK